MNLDQLLAKKTDFSYVDTGGGPSLKRTLGPWGLTALGIGAVIGGGIFVITGQAAAEHAGPAIVLAFFMPAVCCSFTALCYAEFATLIPMAGSSYSYAYATLGEGVAWFIGWNMVLEYGVSASAVAVSRRFSSSVATCWKRDSGEPSSPNPKTSEPRLVRTYRRCLWGPLIALESCRSTFWKLVPVMTTT